jgi:ribonucleoside-diphosphate reductase alpha chain
MASILTLAKTEGMLFKYGSGTGSNLSCMRGSHEGLSAGGTASGPLSFMKGFDSFAGAIKSGGKTRRAAKMVILNIDHPDIEEFILSKANEEKKAWALIDAGYDGSFNGEAYASIFYQNANHSVRVTDEFMEAVEKDAEWQTKEVLTGRPYKTYKARDLMAKIADSAVDLRRSRHAVRHDDQPLEPGQGDAPHQRVEPVQRVHVRRRLGLQTWPRST